MVLDLIPKEELVVSVRKHITMCQEVHVTNVLKESYRKVVEQRIRMQIL